MLTDEQIKSRIDELHPSLSEKDREFFEAQIRFFEEEKDKLNEMIESSSRQVTDLQVAVIELYESMLSMGGV